MISNRELVIAEADRELQKKERAVHLGLDVDVSVTDYDDTHMWGEMSDEEKDRMEEKYAY